MKTNHRYDGKPLLRLLELYVLRAIGELSKDDQATLEAMAPKLREIYEQQGEWHEIIGSTAQLTADAPEAIRGIWERNQRIAADNDQTLSPQQFAEMFVDENLVG